MEFEGGSELDAYGGRKGFNKYPRCIKVAELHQHLDDWVDCLLKYGKDLLGHPRELYHRCLEIIPHELEDEVVMKGDEIKTYQQIVSFCKRRTTHLKYKALSKVAERSPGAHHMNVLKLDGCDVPIAPMYLQAELGQIIAAVKVGAKPEGQLPKEANLRAETPHLGIAFRTTTAWSAPLRTTAAPTVPRTKRSLRLTTDNVQSDM